MASNAEAHVPVRLSSIYLAVWGILMALGVAYLVAMAVRPQMVASVLPPIKIGAVLLDEDTTELRAAALESETLRRQLYASRAESSSLRSELARRTDREAALSSRVAALEGRDGKGADATAVDSQALPTALAPPPKASAALARASDRAKAAKSPPPAQQQQPSSAQLAVERLANAGSQPAIAEPPSRLGRTAPAETASLPVRSDGNTVGLQLGTGPSVDALRLNWALMSQRYGSQLQRLQPRYTANRESGAAGAPAFDLIAGPLPNTAEAQRICDELKAQKVGCKVSNFGGNAL